MVWIDKLKLNKQLTKVLIENGFEEPQEMQFRTLSRIAGGQDVVGIGPEDCGKTTTAVIAILNRFRQGLEGSPRVLMVAPDRDRVDSIIAEFARLNKNNTIRVVPLYKGIELQTQLDDLADGADIVVATPDQARFIYLKLALNLNKIFLYVVDDADIIVKNKLQLPVKELANSIQKAQHLVFSGTFDHNVEKMIHPFMRMPAFVEIEEPSFRILMVCLGNICRSPLAHGILENLIEEKDLNWEVDSAGTGDWHVGQKPDPRSISVAEKYGIDISTQRGRQFSVEDFENFDSILVMDKQNLSDILSLAQNDSQREKVRLFLNGGDIVPDPYLDDTLFEPVYTTIEKGCHAFIKEVLESE